MDVVTHYSPPVTQTSAINVLSTSNPHRGSLSSDDAGRPRETASTLLRGHAGAYDANEKRPIDPQTGTSANLVRSSKAQKAAAVPATTTFNRSAQISLMEPVGSMSLSPANRDVVLAARKGLFIIDLENPYDQPRFLPHLTTWVPADVQWNPHPARANWVASTSNNKLLVWNLDRPEAAPRIEPILSTSAGASAISGTSPSLATSLGMGIISPSGRSTTLPHPHHNTHRQVSESLGAMASRLSSISHVLHAHTRAITDINWSPFHPDVLASCGIDTWTWAWDLRDPSKPKQGYSAWNAAMTQVKWNRATQHRLATSCDNKVLIWDDRKGSLPLATIEAHENRIYGVDWSRDVSLGMSRLVTCSLDGTVKWWDLNSAAAQQAIGQRQLVTEPETVIQTDTPVWRARHLPFGQGVMTLPQRGDCSLSMWSKEIHDEPVHRFNGHRDIVKEYLIRKRGGEDLSTDDRKFQLITWSKDQTLRLWPITDEMTRAVGHERGAPIRVQQTRMGAPDVSYRNPPLFVDVDVTSIGGGGGGEEALSTTQLSQSVPRASPHSSANATPGTSSVVGMGILPPSEATRSLLVGSKLGSMSNHSGSIRKAMTTSPSASLSPIEKFLSPTSIGQPLPTGDGPSDEKHESLGHGQRRIRKAVSITQLAVRETQLRKAVGSGQTSMHARLSQESSLLKQHDSRTNLQMGRQSTIKPSKPAPSANKRIMSRQAASHNFMTRGTTSMGPHAGRLRATGAPKTGNAGRVDAVGWIAGVRVGRAESPSSPSAPAASKRSKSRAAADGKASRAPSMAARAARSVEAGREDKDDAPEKEGADDERGEKARATSKKDSAQVLSEEIMAVSKTVPHATFEKIDVSARTCTASCYGPWAAGKSLPCFIRITLHFPPTYPAVAPRFELEHNASVPLKVRAFVLRNISAILDEYAKREPPQPSMHACLKFLLGQSDDQLDAARRKATQLAGNPFWLPGVEEQEDEEEEEEAARRILAVLKIPPRRCGATFAPNGMLVTFSPSVPSPSHSSAKTSFGDNVGGPPSTAGRYSDAHRQSNADGSIGAFTRRSRFIQSYSALAGAMTSLARLTKEGMSVQDLDVVQLMSDQAFFNKRFQMQPSNAASSSMSPAVAGTVHPQRSRPGSRDTSTRPSSSSKLRMTMDLNTSSAGLLDSGSAAALAMQHRLALVGGASIAGAGVGGGGEPALRTHSRSGRARSASPMSARSARRSENARTGYASPLPRSGGTVLPGDAEQLTTQQHSERSRVQIWDLSDVINGATKRGRSPMRLDLKPPLLRQRSASTPASPSVKPMPRQEFPFAPASNVPESLMRDDFDDDGEHSYRTSRLPPSIAASMLNGGHQGVGESQITEIDSDEADDLAEWAGYRIRQDDSDDSDEESSDGEPNAEQILTESRQNGVNSLAERALDTALWTVPFASLYMVMDIMVQQQYSAHPTAWKETKRMANALPLLTAFIYYTAVRKYDAATRLYVQAVLFAVGTATGCAFLFTYVRSNHLVVTRRTAPLGTLWVYSVARLDLTFVVASLAIVYGFVVHQKLDLFA